MAAFTLVIAVATIRYSMILFTTLRAGISGTLLAAASWRAFWNARRTKRRKMGMLQVFEGSDRYVPNPGSGTAEELFRVR